jgi:hypothetical protein
MQLRPDIQIQSILKAMTDVVLPALDPNNQIAQEQARLCMGLLNVMAQQLPLQFRFDCDELTRLVALAKQMQPLPELARVSDATRQKLAEQTLQADNVLARAKAEPAEVLNAVRSLRALTGAVVQEACAQGDGSATAELERAVFDMSRQQLQRDRVWLLAQGWEPDAKALPALETLLAPVGAGA